MKHRPQHDVLTPGQTVIVLPIGSYEWHGGVDYLPSDTDAIIAKKLAKGIGKKFDLPVLPAVNFSCSQEHAGWSETVPGRGKTVSVDARIAYSYVLSILESLQDQQITRVLIVSGHGGNYWLQNLVQTVNAQGRMRVSLFPDAEDRKFAHDFARLETPSGRGIEHVGEEEYSQIAHYKPKRLGVLPSHPDQVRSAKALSRLLREGTKELTPTGVLGSPSLGTATKGERLHRGYVKSAGHHVKALCAWTPATVDPRSAASRLTTSAAAPQRSERRHSGR